MKIDENGWTWKWTNVYRSGWKWIKISAVLHVSLMPYFSVKCWKSNVEYEVKKSPMLKMFYRAWFSILTSCNCWPISSSLLTNSASHPDWGCLITGLDFLFMPLRKKLLTTPSWLMTTKLLCQVRCSQYKSLFDISPAFQFTICSSATSDALTTVLSFFQLQRQSGNPWISLCMDSLHDKEGNIFELTVMSLPDSYLTWRSIWLKPF